ncbi:MAG: hypothetical protein ACPL6F_00435 [Anaerolineales bacterium]
MFPKKQFLIILVLVAAIVFSAVQPLSSKRVWLTVINRTLGKASIQLKNGSTSYQFKIRQGKTSVYAVRPLEYKATFSGCANQAVKRNLSMNQPLRMTLVCNPNVPLGEPGMIKIVIYSPAVLDRK